VISVALGHEVGVRFPLDPADEERDNIRLHRNGHVASEAVLFQPERLARTSKPPIPET
jgi:hypothetical protein